MTAKTFAFESENIARINVIPDNLKNVGVTLIEIETFYSQGQIDLVAEYADGDSTLDMLTAITRKELKAKEISQLYLNVPEKAVCKIALYRGDDLVSSFAEGDFVTITEVKYKVDLQAASANVNVWDDSVGAVTALSWQTGLSLQLNQAGIIHKRGAFSSDFWMSGTSGERDLEDGANTTAIVIQAGANPLVIWLSYFKLTKANGQVIDFVPTAGRNSAVTIL